ISLKLHGNEELSREPAEKNLAYRAVEALRGELKIASAVEIELRKKIPPGRADRTSRFPRGGRAVFSLWRPRPGHKPRRRDLSSAGRSEAVLAHRFSQGHSRADSGRVSLAERSRG